MIVILCTVIIGIIFSWKIGNPIPMLIPVWGLIMEIVLPSTNSKMNKVLHWKYKRLHDNSYTVGRPSASKEYYFEKI